MGINVYGEIENALIYSFLTMVALKLFGVLSLPWTAVLIPAYISVGMFIVVFYIFYVNIKDKED